MPVAPVDEKDPWGVVSVGETVQEDPWAVVSVGEAVQEDPWAVASIEEQPAISRAPEPTFWEKVSEGAKDIFSGRPSKEMMRPKDIAEAQIKLEAKKEGLSKEGYERKVYPEGELYRRGERYGKGFESGVIGTAGGIAGFADWITEGEIGKDFAMQARLWQQERTPDEADFSDAVASGAGSMATFFIPGVGIAKGGGLVARIGPRLAAWAGAGASGVMEAAVEAGGVYEDALLKTKDVKEAESAAAKTFWWNVPLVVITNKLGFLGETGGAIKRGIVSSQIEGFQETAQEYISKSSKGEKATLGDLLTAYGVGSLTGGPSGVISAKMDAKGAAIEGEQIKPPPSLADPAAGVKTTEDILAEGEKAKQEYIKKKQAFTVEDQLKAKQPELYAQLKKEIEDAKGIREDEGQVSEGGAAAEGSQEEGSQNLEQQTSGKPSGEGLGQEGIEITDRRQDVETRKRVAEMSTEEMQSALLTDELTGLKNKRAYTEAEKKPVQVKSDVDGLKWVNDNYGEEAGNALLKAKADALKAEGIDAYRTGGDEYYSQFDSPEQADAAMKNVAKRLENAIIDAKSPDGKILKYSGGRFSYGIGKDAASADTALRASKEVRERTGERAGRGVKPVGLVEVAEGQRMGEIGDKAVSNIPAGKVIPPKEVKFKGRASTVATERGTKTDTAFAVVDINDLSASHDTALNPNKDYPAELQPRQRERAASQLQIDKIINKLNPEFLGESPKASEGAPIVGKDLIVESGNGRIIALKKGYEGGHKNIEAYRQWLKDNAEKFGLSKEDIEKVNNPVLVRIRQSDVDRVQFVRESNEQTVAAMSASEQAKADAGVLTNDLMSVFEPGESGEINTAKNRDFIRAFLQKVVPANELGRYVDSDGNVSQEGIRRIGNAIFAKAYGDAAIIEKFTESTDNNIRQIANIMVAMGPKFAMLQDGINNGELHNLNITDDIAQAAKKLSQLREAGQSFKDYLNQGALFDDGITPLSKDVIGIFDFYKRNPKKLKTVFENYINAVELLGSPKQEALFGMKEMPTRAEILQAAIRKMEVDANVQASLFKSEDAGGYEGVSPAEGGEKGAKAAESETGKEVGGAATADTGQYTKTERQAIELPEITELANELMEGKFPYIKRKLRVMKGMAAGVFHPKIGTIGLRADIFKDVHKASRVMAHEIGHLVDWLPDRYIQRGNLLGRIATLKKYMQGAYQGLMSNFTIRDELKALTQFIKPFDEQANRKFTKYRYSSKELYADAFSMLINDPALLKETAPNFYEGFFEYLDRKPEVKALYDELQERIKDKGAVLENRDIKSRQMSKKGEKLRKAKEQKGATSLTALGNAFKKALIDENTEIINKIKKAKKEGKISDESLRYKLEEKAYIPSEILAYRNRVDEEIVLPLEKQGITIEDVGEYVKYRRIATERAEIANPLGHTKETAERQLKLLKARLGDAKYTELEAGIKKFWEIRKSHIISLLKEADMYSDALMKKIEDNENYATFNVLDAIEKQYGRGVTGQLYKQIGTLHEIENPFVATVLKDAALIRAARLNNIKKDITRFLHDIDGSLTDADTKWNGKFQEPVDPRDPNMGLLTYMEKGKVKAYYAPKEIADTFKYDPRQANIITKIWQTIHAPVRSAMVSHNPIWMVRNVVKDFLGTVKNIPGMTAPKLFKYYAGSISEAAKSAFLGEKTENVQKMLKERMLVPNRQYEARDISTEAQIDRVMEKIGDSPVRYRNFVVKPFVKLWDYLGRMGQFTERWAKLAGYKYLKDTQAKEGLSEERIGHLVRSRVGTPDVYRRGSANIITNNLFLFSNVNKEGWRASYEAARENPAEYTWKSIKFNAIPKMILFAGLAGAFGDELKKILEGISDYDKGNYVIVPLGKTREGKSVFFRIPQDYTGQVVGALTWDLLNGRIAGKKGAIREAASQQPYQWSPVIEVAGDVAQYALYGLNPYDEYFGGHVLDETVYKAGGARAWKDLAKYSAKQLGANAVYDFKGTSVKEVEGELEKMLKNPGMSVLGTFLKVSDLGHKEKLREVKQGAEKKEARRQLGVRDRIVADINAITDEGRKPTVKDMVLLYKELKKEKLLDITMSVGQFRHRYDRYASKAKNSIEIDAVINAATNEEKAALLKYYKETMGEDGYRNIFRQLVREGFNPQGAMLKMRLKERRAEMEAVDNGE